MDNFTPETKAFQQHVFNLLSKELVFEQDSEAKAQKTTAFYSVLGWIVAAQCAGDPERIDRVWAASEAFILRSAVTAAPICRDLFNEVRDVPKSN